jgi:hypothetical protein
MILFFGEQSHMVDDRKLLADCFNSLQSSEGSWWHELEESLPYSIIILHVLPPLLVCTNILSSRYSSVGIVTRYGLDDPGIESQLGRARFSASIQTGPWAHPASYTMSTRSFPGVKRPGHGIDHPTQSSAEVKECVEIYCYSTSGPSWPVLGWTLRFAFTFH